MEDEGLKVKLKQYPVPAKKARGIIISHPLIVILQNNIKSQIMIFNIWNYETHAC